MQLEGDQRTLSPPQARVLLGAIRKQCLATMTSESPGAPFPASQCLPQLPRAVFSPTACWLVFALGREQERPDRPTGGAALAVVRYKHAVTKWTGGKGTTSLFHACCVLHRNSPRHCRCTVQAAPGDPPRSRACLKRCDGHS